MTILMSFVIPFVLVHHGFNSVVLKIISEIKSVSNTGVRLRTSRTTSPLSSS
jgi:hypothetical protein